jgi:endonuclease/exonuclease/phosphatase family metal-dependent hydrolase
MVGRAVVLAVVLAAASGVAASAAHAGDLTVATFNSEFLNRDKVHIKFGFGFNESPGWSAAERMAKLREASSAVAEVIAGIDADVIVLTEVGDTDDVNILRDAIEAQGVDYDFVAVGDSADYSTGQHVAVLSKHRLTDILAEIPGREHFFEETDDWETEVDTGISKGMKVSFAFEGREFDLYAVHFISERGGHDADQQRIAQASIVRRHYLPAMLEGKNIIVAGDLNEKPGQPTLTRLRGLDDLQPDLIQTGHAKWFAGDALDTRWTYEYMGIRQQIDHVLLSRSILDDVGPSDINARTVDHGNELASDHRAWVVRVSY